MQGADHAVGVRLQLAAVGPDQALERALFATLGGAAVVTKLVASSMAGPNGVGMVIRNGTRIRVPAIGTKAISILRWDARYLMTGRSGI